MYQTSADKEGNIWILTDSRLIRKHAEKEEFQEIRLDETHCVSPYYSICHDDRGIYFGSERKILRYSYENDSLYVFFEYKDSIDYAFKHIKRLGRGRLLCGSDNGVVIIETGINNTTPKAIKLSDKEVSSILIDNKQHIWIAFYNSGIQVYKNR